MTSRQQQKRHDRKHGENRPPDKPGAYGVPQPPPVEKRWAFTRAQKIGVPLIMLLPLLALLGVFGESFETVSDRGETLALEVNYPTRYRYKMLNSLVVTVENIAPQTVPTVTVAFDEAYISQFSTVTFTPSIAEIAGDAYYVQLKEVKAGEVRRIVVELQGEKYWWHEGTIAVMPGGTDAATDVAVEVRTLIYP